MTPVGSAPAPPAVAARHRPALPTLGGAVPRAARTAACAVAPPRDLSPRPADATGPDALASVSACTLLVLLVAFGAIVVRLVQVQALAGEEYAAFGASQRFQDITLPADRGSIFDRNGNDLAVSLPQQTIWANPSLIEHPLEVASALAGPLAPRRGRHHGAGRQARRRRRVHVRRPARRRRCRRAGRGARAPRHRLHRGAEAVRAGRRPRPLGPRPGRAWTTRVSRGSRSSTTTPSPGEPGQLVIEKDPDGRTIPGGEHERVPAERGDDLVLTIDRSMQYEAERALAAQIIGQGRPRAARPSCPVPAPARSWPWPTSPPTPRPARSWPPGNNLGATAVYEPGSVNKVITVAAALEEGLVTPSTELTVPDSLQVSDHLFTDHDPHPTERYSVTRILTESSNIGTIMLAQQLGKDKLDHYLRALRLRHHDRPRVPERGGRARCSPRRTTAARRSARSRSARASP